MLTLPVFFSATVLVLPCMSYGIVFPVEGLPAPFRAGMTWPSPETGSYSLDSLCQGLSMISLISTPTIVKYSWLIDWPFWQNKFCRESLHGTCWRSGGYYILLLFVRPHSGRLARCRLPSRYQMPWLHQSHRWDRGGPGLISARLTPAVASVDAPRQGESAPMGDIPLSRGPPNICVSRHIRSVCIGTYIIIWDRSLATTYLRCSRRILHDHSTLIACVTVHRVSDRWWSVITEVCLLVIFVLQ